MPATMTKEPNQGLRRHKLLPADVRKAFPRFRSTDGQGFDAKVIVKFFCPYGAGTWLFTEFDGDDTLYGYGSPSGLAEAEWGYQSFTEIASTTVMGRVPAIERDCYYDGVTVREALAAEGIHR